MSSIVARFFILFILFAGSLAHAGSTEKSIAFPPHFWWGTSLAAHQAEGGNVNTWSQWEDLGHSKNHETSGVADDHWNRYEEDFDLLVWLHANTHRMSIEWSRLEPAPGQWNEAAALHYREMILALKKRNIRPVICLFHFSLPIWVGEAGGFENPKMVDAFINFVSKAQGAFGDLVEDWLTMNEPNVYALGGYAGGGTPPGVNDIGRAAQVFTNLMKANGRAYQVLKKQDPHSSVSFAHHMRVFAPKNKFSILDHEGSVWADEFFNWSWLNVIKTGKIVLSIPTMVNLKDECTECIGALDYLGINYYSRDHISVSPLGKDKIKLSVPESAPKNSMGWEIYPEGLGEILGQVKSRGFQKYPILITENGIPDDNDNQRSIFIYQHLKTFLETSKKLGLIPMGYLHWSLIDNFEWLEGRAPHFGLIEIDYKTLQRKIRPSAAYFRQMGIEQSLFAPSESNRGAPAR